jgi:hypothetical protein
MTMKLEPTTPAPTQKVNIFVRLWRGDVRLGITFWVWGFLVLLILRGLDAMLVRQLSTFTTYLEYYYGFIGLSIAYTIYIWVAIWRSANKSDASVGPGLAKIWVVLGFFQSMVTYTTLIVDLNKSEYTKADIWGIAYEVNKALPSKIDSITTLEKLTAKERTLTYNFTVDLDGIDQYDVSRLRAQVLANVCTTEDALDLINNNVVLNYEYFNHTKSPMLTLAFDANTCDFSSDSAAASKSPLGRAAEIREEIAEIARLRNETLPMMLDEETRYDQIELGSGLRVINSYTLYNYSSTEITSTDFREYIQQPGIAGACENGAMKELLQHGGTYVYVYKGNNDVEIDRFEVSREDCGYEAL